MACPGLPCVDIAVSELGSVAHLLEASTKPLESARKRSLSEVSAKKHRGTSLT